MRPALSGRLPNTTASRPGRGSSPRPRRIGGVPVPTRMAIATARHPAGPQSDAEGIMTIRRIAILAVALAALSACKAVTLAGSHRDPAHVRHRSRGLGRACDGRAPSGRLSRPDTDDPSDRRRHQHPRPSRNAHRSQPAGDDQRPIRQQPGYRSIPGSIWLPAAGQGGTFDDDIQTQLAVTLANITDDECRTTDRGSTAWTPSAGCPTTPPCVLTRSVTRTSTGIAAASLRGRRRISPREWPAGKPRTAPGRSRRTVRGVVAAFDREAAGSPAGLNLGRTGEPVQCRWMPIAASASA